MAPMTQIPHLARKLADPDQGAQSQGTTSHSSAAAMARNSINQYVTDIHSQVQGEGQVLLPSSGSRRLPPINCHSAISLIAQDMILAPASQAFVERLF